MKEKMIQKSGSESTNIQVGGDAHFGLSYDDAKKISLDVFKANFYEFSESAAKRAMERAEEITEKFLRSFFEDNTQDKTKLEEPAAQISIYEVQKAYVSTGDKQLEQRLLDTLLTRLKSEERSINQIVLDEAIHLLPKLTDNEISLLSFSVSAREILYQQINTLQAFADFVNQGLLKFFPVVLTKAEFQHLQYCGCFTLPTGGPIFSMPLGEYMRNRFKGLLTNGFSENDFKIETNGMDISSLGTFVIKNLRNPLNFQFNALHDSEFDNELSKFELDLCSKMLKALWNKSAMSNNEVDDILIEINPRSKDMIHAWNKSIMPLMQLTPVGYAIAIINYNRVMNTKLDFWAFT